jgi:hypothetical protein
MGQVIELRSQGKRPHKSPTIIKKLSVKGNIEENDEVYRICAYPSKGLK